MSCWPKNGQNVQSEAGHCQRLEENAPDPKVEPETMLVSADGSFICLRFSLAVDGRLLRAELIVEGRPSGNSPPGFFYL